MERIDISITMCALASFAALAMMFFTAHDAEPLWTIVFAAEAILSSFVCEHYIHLKEAKKRAEAPE